VNSRGILATIALLALTPSLWAELKGLPGVPYERRLNVYWADTPPVLDGKLDDACWKSAEVATDFRLIFDARKNPLHRTEIRMCYDAQYLYFFYLLHDDKIDKLQVGMPDDARDVVKVNEDVVELFLDPQRSKQAYYQFMTTPLGARFDLRVTPEKKREVGTYTPEWIVAPHIGEKSWAVEIRIPFSELVFDNSFIGTPVPGEEWGVNFCRDQGYRKEWALWSPHKQKSFHRPNQFGVAVFRGHRESRPALHWRDNEKLGLGPGNLQLLGQEGTSGLEAKWTVLHNRKPAHNVGKADNRTPLAFQYRFASGGRWDIRVLVTHNQQPLFYGRALATLPLLKKLILDITDTLEPGLERLNTLTDMPGLTSLRRDLTALDKATAPLARHLQNPEELSRLQWNDLLHAMPEIETKWTSLSYDLKTLRHYTANEGEPPRFLVGSANAYERIYPDTVLPQVSRGIHLWGAGRERESFQLGIMPFLRSVKNITVEFSELKGDAGIIPASCFEYNIVGFVKMHQSWGGGWSSDVLYPGKAFDLSKNHTQPVWVNLLVPAGAKAGVYRGNVMISAAGRTQTVPVTLHAFGFDIPERRSLRIEPWYWPAENAWRKYYKLKNANFTPEIYEKHLKVLSAYRQACYPLDTRAMWDHLKIYLEKDGALTFDFSGWDWIFDLGQKYGADNLGASFGCNFNSLRPTFSGRIPIFDRATGKKVSTPAKYAWNTANWKYVRGKTHKPDFAANPVYRQYLKQLVEYLRRRGVLKYAHYEIYDEPKTRMEFKEALRMHDFLQKFVPELLLKSYGVGPWKYQDTPDMRPIDYFDVWAPSLYTITPERMEQLSERQQKGEEFWFYTCSAGYRDADRKSRPHICLYQHPLAPRIHGWAARKLGADGFLTFALMAGFPNNVQQDSKHYYAKPIWHGTRTAGQGYLIYPGPDQELIPSIRLAAQRDGLEDYEFFAVLDDRLKQLDSGKHAALIKRIQRALVVPEVIVSWDWHEWSRDPNKFEEKRKQLAALIVEAETILKKTDR
jgi:hypothetical protein